jgi:hypothetical protein
VENQKNGCWLGIVECKYQETIYQLVLHGVRMKYPWIKNYAGTWQNEEGKTLVIRIQDDENATVDLLIHGSPMIRP